jgi:hypothetical protein
VRSEKKVVGAESVQCWTDCVSLKRQRGERRSWSATRLVQTRCLVTLVVWTMRLVTLVMSVKRTAKLEVLACQ